MASRFMIGGKLSVRFGYVHVYKSLIQTVFRTYISVQRGLQSKSPFESGFSVSAAIGGFLLSMPRSLPTNVARDKLPTELCGETRFGGRGSQGSS